ncbi:MAG: DUF6252 family protein [Urechidicola sp.]|nr:DUF6252 family protein [Urechidicola sp.]
MKNFKIKFLLIAVFTVVAFTSCNNDDDDNGGGSGDEFLTAKIDGADFAASTSPATIIGATITNGLLAVQGGDNSGNTISFQVFGYTGLGVYATADALTSTNGIRYITISPVATWDSSGVTSIIGITPGRIEVTFDDGVTVEGTFSFEGYNAADMTTKTITEGEFKAVLQ